MKSALQFYLDEIVEEIDPLILKSWLGAKSWDELKINKLSKIVGRRERAEKFCMSLKETGSDIVQDVLHAMKFCGYEDIAGDIINIAREGPLSNLYRCPNVTNLTQNNERCVYNETYKFKEYLDEEEAPNLEIDVEKSMITSMIPRDKRLGPIQSLKGVTESVLLSGSGLIKSTKDFLGSLLKTESDKCSSSSTEETTSNEAKGAEGENKFVSWTKEFSWPLPTIQLKKSNIKEQTLKTVDK
ncbi:uncharacterized protein LOC132721197 [Ruditapes philippinarum]|uniref:uncharacterized protein LOC132721197 n=1 Tax=Ruditapes philippinarum TaxID=129788 RepID=UPI00295B013E|nr:uncharacterized protein LOC132721197 [Ruditapes philippinarum]